MFGHGQLIHCQQRKAALLQQSSEHRGALLTALRDLRPVADWMDLGIIVARKARTGWSVLGSLLSLWQTRKPESSGFLQKLARAVSFARSLAELWKNRK